MALQDCVEPPKPWGKCQKRVQNPLPKRSMDAWNIFGGIALGLMNLAHNIVRSLLEAGGLRARLHPGS